MISATRLTVILLLLVAAAHLVRIVLGIEVIVGRTTVPMWISGVAIVVPIALATALWREHRR
jgi:hypothetical protein